MEHKMNRRGRTSSSSLPVHLLGRGRGRGRGRGWDFSRAQEGPDTREDLYRQCGPHLTAEPAGSNGVGYGGGDGARARGVPAGWCMDPVLAALHLGAGSTSFFENSGEMKMLSESATSLCEKGLYRDAERASTAALRVFMGAIAEDERLADAMVPFEHNIRVAKDAAVAETARRKNLEKVQHHPDHHQPPAIPPPPTGKTRGSRHRKERDGLGDAKEGHAAQAAGRKGRGRRKPRKGEEFHDSNSGSNNSSSNTRINSHKGKGTGSNPKGTQRQGGDGNTSGSVDGVSSHSSGGTGSKPGGSAKVSTDSATASRGGGGGGGGGDRDRGGNDDVFLDHDSEGLKEAIMLSLLDAECTSKPNLGRADMFADAVADVDAGVGVGMDADAANWGVHADAADSDDGLAEALQRSMLSFAEEQSGQ